ncbi:unnamed protein product [Schistosoma margrebowiei]|uniref:Uncharacterized protein n=1 Tax=Schistosoma margrebowiei TaxID=48269 RepID=A0AA85AFT5_9TREM|nr:unnamed protein product [Schistosoma margrebowiei]
MKRQKDVQLESKPKIQKRTDFLNDLDGLLVSSKNFNKLFVQKTSQEWIKTQVEKLVQSHIHLFRFIEVLTNFVVSGNHHPHVVQQVLVWLDYCLQHHSTSMQTPEIQKVLKNLCSYYYEMYGMGNMFLKAANRGSAMENWSNVQKLISHFPRRFYYPVLPKTKFVYIDDESNPTGKSNAPLNLYSSENNEENLDILNDEYLDVDTMSLMKDDSEYEQESLYQSVEESDAGVFDVNEPLSPDAEQFLNSINDDWEDEIISSEAESDSDKFIYPEIKDSEDDLSVSSEISSTSVKTSLFPDVTEQLGTVNNGEKNEKVVKPKTSKSNYSALSQSPSNRQKNRRSSSRITTSQKH